MAVVQRRVGFLFAGFIVLLGIAGARALYLGGPHSGALRRAAQTQQVTYETVPAQRGTITDRNGVALAISEPAQELSADPYLIKDPLGRASQPGSATGPHPGAGAHHAQRARRFREARKRASL